MYKTAGRINAVLSAVLDNLTELKKRPGANLRIYDKGRRSKYPEGRPWDKYVSPDLLKEISEITGFPEKKEGPIFSLSESDMAEINKKALEKLCPWVFEKYPHIMPNHFWRHMFAQHMLRKTGWNYAAVAALGGWSVTALERNYGKPPDEQVRQWGMKQIPDL